MGFSIFYLRLRQFAARHHIERDSGPLNLGSTLFRRTYSTRALYEGQSIEAISSQLGHSSILTTLLYVKVDLVEHPSQVRDALDIYGRHALTFWKTPVLLDSLPAAERKRLLQERTKHDQDVGLCQEDRCIYLDRGGPPPCSLCEHLATGKVFLLAWYYVLQARECELEKLKMMPDAGMFYAQLKGQLDQFKRNLAMVGTIVRMTGMSRLNRQAPPDEREATAVYEYPLEHWQGCAELWKEKSVIPKIFSSWLMMSGTRGPMHKRGAQQKPTTIASVFGGFSRS